MKGIPVVCISMLPLNNATTQINNPIIKKYRWPFSLAKHERRPGLHFIHNYIYLAVFFAPFRPCCNPHLLNFYSLLSYETRTLKALQHKISIVSLTIFLNDQTFLKEIKSSLSILESDAEDDSYFDVFFPSFIMVIRDINVKLVDDTNKPISPDQYLETALVLKRGSSDSIREYNLPRQLVRRYFKNRKCFKFATPRSPNELDKGILAKNMEFENDVKAFTEHIYKCKPKRMTSGKTLNGRSKCKYYPAGT